MNFFHSLEVLLYCSVRVTPYKRTPLTTPFLLACPADLMQGRVNLYVNLCGPNVAEMSNRKFPLRKTSPNTPLEIKLPDMSELNLPTISEDEDMFG